MKKFIRFVFFGGDGTTSAAGDFGLGLARIGVGVMMFIGYGLGKIWGNHGFGPSQGFIDMIANMGVPSPVLMAWLSTLTESVAAALLVVGLFTRLSALTLVINMCVAAFLAMGAQPFFSNSGPSKERPLLYLIAFITFLFIGAGRFSLDRLIRGRATTAVS
ncbi:MAG: DoxX family protein [Phycisphaerales bacterium]|nr:DoxX family protein [Phycisphaerales bacterium]